MNAKNNTKNSALTPAFTAPAGEATSATISWNLSGSTDLTACAQVVLKAPNGSTKILKAFNSANTGFADVLDLYNPVGLGTYTLSLQEQSSCGSKSQNARITSAAMTVEKQSSCN